MFWSIALRVVFGVGRRMLRRAGYDVPPLRRLRPRRMARDLAVGRSPFARGAGPLGVRALARRLQR